VQGLSESFSIREDLIGLQMARLRELSLTLLALLAAHALAQVCAESESLDVIFMNLPRLVPQIACGASCIDQENKAPLSCYTLTHLASVSV
jgi:hypothetical protein